MELQWGAALEVGERLMLADVEGGSRVPVQQVLSQFLDILPGGRTRKHSWIGRRELAARA